MRAPNGIGRVMENVGVGDKKTDVLSMTKRRGGALIIAPKVEGEGNNITRTAKE